MAAACSIFNTTLEACPRQFAQIIHDVSSGASTPEDGLKRTNGIISSLEDLRIDIEGAKRYVGDVRHGNRYDRAYARVVLARLAGQLDSVASTKAYILDAWSHLSKDLKLAQTRHLGILVKVNSEPDVYTPPPPYLAPTIPPGGMAACPHCSKCAR
jgi:hypothetical protein